MAHFHGDRQQLQYLNICASSIHPSEIKFLDFPRQRDRKLDISIKIFLNRCFLLCQGKQSFPCSHRLIFLLNHSRWQIRRLIVTDSHLALTNEIFVRDFLYLHEIENVERAEIGGFDKNGEGNQQSLHELGKYEVSNEFVIEAAVPTTKANDIERRSFRIRTTRQEDRERAVLILAQLSRRARSAAQWRRRFEGSQRIVGAMYRSTLYQCFITSLMLTVPPPPKKNRNTLSPIDRHPQSQRAGARGGGLPGDVLERGRLGPGRGGCGRGGDRRASSSRT